MGVFSAFNARACKLEATQGINRIKAIRNKKQRELLGVEKRVADLLDEEKNEQAMICVEQALRIENLLKAMEMLEIYLELLKTRVEQIAKSKEMPMDMRSAIASLCFAAPRVPDIPELAVIRKQLEGKYGKAAAPMAETNENLQNYLSVEPPHEAVKERCVEAISQKLRKKGVGKAVAEQAMGFFRPQPAVPAPMQTGMNEITLPPGALRPADYPTAPAPVPAAAPAPAAPAPAAKAPAARAPAPAARPTAHAAGVSALSGQMPAAPPAPAHASPAEGPYIREFIPPSSVVPQPFTDSSIVTPTDTTDPELFLGAAQSGNPPESKQGRPNDPSVGPPLAAHAGGSAQVSVHPGYSHSPALTSYVPAVPESYTPPDQQMPDMKDTGEAPMPPTSFQAAIEAAMVADQSAAQPLLDSTNPGEVQIFGVGQHPQPGGVAPEATIPPPDPAESVPTWEPMDGPPDVLAHKKPSPDGSFPQVPTLPATGASLDLPTIPQTSTAGVMFDPPKPAEQVPLDDDLEARLRKLQM